MRLRFASWSFVVCFVGSGFVRGETITFSSHEASGSGTANVFDGGPPAFGSGTTFDAADPEMHFGALDWTQPGSLGASAGASGTSRIVANDDDRMLVLVDFVANYRGSLSPGGDNPGGMAEGELSSVIEFIMPVDELDWTYGFSTEATIEFEGTASVVFENVTQAETLLTLTENTPFFETTLSATTGDLMRITTMMSGGGNTPGGGRKYDAGFAMTFTIPEPGTLAVLALGSLLALRRRRGAVRQYWLRPGFDSRTRVVRSGESQSTLTDSGSKRIETVVDLPGSDSMVIE